MTRETTTQPTEQAEGHAPRRPAGVKGLWTSYLRTILVAATYRPERRYMRGAPPEVGPRN
jgi:hypothetical protein